MNPTHLFPSSMPEAGGRRLTVGWLLLALWGLAAPGIFTILVVFSRTPGLNRIIPGVESFKTALVIHVDMTVLVWFLAFAGVFWAILYGGRQGKAGTVALWLAGLGSLILTLSPFAGGQPLMNNYVPVLLNPVFFAGLILFCLGFAIVAFLAVLSFRPPYLQEAGGALHFAVTTAMAAGLVAMAAWLWSLSQLPQDRDPEGYYELLFWGGGHALQFTHTQLVLIAWLWLGWASRAPAPMSGRLIISFLALGFLPVLATPLIYGAYTVDSPELRLAFSDLMIYGGGLGTLPVGLAVAWGWWKSGPPPEALRPERTALFWSMLLFGLGGAVGFLIDGINVIIPAHYHGSIVGVTIAYMGVTYALLPRLGFSPVPVTWAVWQARLYGLGELLHILGLTWSGGYGVQRKAGAAQELDIIEKKIGMGIMGLGGGIAIVSVALFLVLVIRAMRSNGTSTT